MEKQSTFNNNFQNEQYYGVGGFILEIIKIFILALMIIIPIRAFLFQPFFVQGASMEPSFENNQYLIVNEFGYKKTVVDIGGKNFFTVDPFKDLKRQQIIVFRYPKDTTKFFIKRIIGLPGEKIEIKDGKVKIYNQENLDGFILDESAYLSSNIKMSENLNMTLKNDAYFVMGDNRLFSSDSRVWGPVSKDDVIGSVLLRAWPLNKISIF